MKMTRQLIYFGAIIFVSWMLLSWLFPETFSLDTHKQDLKVAKDIVELAEKADDVVGQGVASLSTSVKKSLGSEDEGLPTGTRINEYEEPILYEGEVWDEANQRYLFQQVVEVKTKFPLLVRQKIWKASNDHPSGRIFVGENAFVADHVMVRVREGYSEAYVSQVMRSEGMDVRKRLNNENLYLIEFPVVSFDSWNQAVERLRELPIVQAIAPDLLGGIPK